MSATARAAPLPYPEPDSREPLPAARAYALWARTYEIENGVTLADRIAVAELSPLRHARLLDAGCGTGRRLPRAGFSAGVDLVFEMLTAGARPPRLHNADILALPFGGAAFDLVHCRLALGHVADAGAAYRELARACAPGGALVVTDVHPGYFEAGCARRFTDANGRRHTIEHFVRGEAEHARAAEAAGWRFDRTRVVSVGPELRPAFESVGMLERYESQLGMAVVLGLRFVRG